MLKGKVTERGWIAWRARIFEGRRYFCCLGGKTEWEKGFFRGYSLRKKRTESLGERLREGRENQ